MSKHDTDFVAWAEEQAQHLRERRFELLDLDNLIDEVDDLAGRHRDALESHLRVAMIHLLKLSYTEGSRAPKQNWRRSVRDARDEVDDLLERYPSLRYYLPKEYATAYRKAKRDAHKQLADYGDSHAPFPDACPWSVEQVLDEGFWPGDVDRAT
jgi:hypothetical protein